MLPFLTSKPRHLRLNYRHRLRNKLDGARVLRVLSPCPYPMARLVTVGICLSWQSNDVVFLDISAIFSMLLAWLKSFLLL